MKIRKLGEYVDPGLVCPVPGSKEDLCDHSLANECTTESILRRYGEDVVNRFGHMEYGDGTGLVADPVDLVAGIASVMTDLKTQLGREPTLSDINTIIDTGKMPVSTQEVKNEETSQNVDEKVENDVQASSPEIASAK